MITQQIIKELVDYNPSSGTMVWRERPEKYFKTKKDFIIWNKRFSLRKAGTMNNNGYLKITIFGKQGYVHRMAWLYVHGELPKNEIDHINHNRADNRIDNLRAVSKQENSRNAELRITNKSGTHGVCWNKKTSMWEAQITVDYKRINLGRYAHIEDAATARKEAEVKYGFHPNHGGRL